jgi:hypothetical protein
VAIIMYRPVHHPTPQPSITPSPSFSFNPTLSPTETHQPTPKPTFFPTATIAEAGFTDYAESLIIPLCIAFVGILMGVYIFKRDEKRAKHWVRITPHTPQNPPVLFSRYPLIALVLLTNLSIPSKYIIY